MYERVTYNAIALLLCTLGFEPFWFRVCHHIVCVSASIYPDTSHTGESSLPRITSSATKQPLLCWMRIQSGWLDLSTGFCVMSTGSESGVRQADWDTSLSASVGRVSVVESACEYRACITGTATALHRLSRERGATVRSGQATAHNCRVRQDASRPPATTTNNNCLTFRGHRVCMCMQLSDYIIYKLGVFEKSCSDQIASILFTRRRLWSYNLSRSAQHEARHAPAHGIR